MTNEEAHELARKRGTSRLIYGTARFVFTPIAGIWYRLEVTGDEYVLNHKSFYDSFFIVLATRRHLHFTAMTEPFEGRSARLLSGLGAFPVRRGVAYNKSQRKRPKRNIVVRKVSSPPSAGARRRARAPSGASEPASRDGFARGPDTRVKS